MSGSFEQGFPVLLRIREDGSVNEIAQAVGHLPPAVDVLEAFQNWQSAYDSWHSDYRQNRITPRQNPVTNVNWDELGSQMRERLNNWLNSGSRQWQRIRDQLLRHLRETDDEIQAIVQTNDAQLRKLPWNLWDLFSEQYRKAEIALSLPDVQPPRDRQLVLTNNIRILAILGDTTNINVEQDRAILNNELPQAEIIFLQEPQRQELYYQLWEQDWDIIFFAGHSDSYENGETGRIYINENDFLRLDELEYPLKRAIRGGLKLAIFNSCDGLGLAHRLAMWGLPQSIVMRQPVPDFVAQEFLKNFLGAFVRRRSLYLAVREARERLQVLQWQFPYASWLPVIYQNTVVTPLILPEPPPNPPQPPPVTPKPPKPRQPLRSLLYPIRSLLYHRIFKYFMILLVGVVIVMLLIIGLWKPPIIVPPKLCDLPATDISDIDFSPDGKYLATGNLDNTVRLLEVEGTSTKQVDCKSHKEGVVAVKFSPDGKKLATASLDSTAGLMDISDNGKFTVLEENKDTTFPVVALNFSPDGKHLATGSADGNVRIWDTESPNHDKVAHFEHKQSKKSVYVKAVSFSQDGKYLAIASLNNKAQVWDWQTDKEGKKLKPLPPEDVVDVVFSPPNPTNKNYLATASADGTIQVWDMNSRDNAIPQLNVKSYPMTISFSPGGEHIAITSLNNKPQVWWDWQTHPDQAIPLSQDNVVAVAFSPTNREHIATASADGTINLWKTNAGFVKTLNKGDRVKNSLVDIAFNPADDHYLATASADGTVNIINYPDK
jgi:WD40 repeat protein